MKLSRLAEFKNGNLNGALSTLVKSEYLIINATYDDKSEFYKLAEIKSIADKILTLGQT
jgi:hypothetical protein